MGANKQGRFERRPSTESERFAFLGNALAHILGQIVSIRVKTLGNTNLWRQGMLKRKTPHFWLTCAFQKVFA